MGNRSRPPPTHLFTLRVWPEDRGDGVCEWWGQVKNITSGEVRYFRHWSELVQVLPSMLANAEPPDPENQP